MSALTQTSFSSEEEPGYIGCLTPPLSRPVHEQLVRDRRSIPVSESVEELEKID